MLVAPAFGMNIDKRYASLVAALAPTVGPTAVVARHTQTHPRHVVLFGRMTPGNAGVTYCAGYVLSHVNFVIEHNRPIRIQGCRWFIRISMAHAALGVVRDLLVTAGADFHRRQIPIGGRNAGVRGAMADHTRDFKLGHMFGVREDDVADLWFQGS